MDVTKLAVDPDEVSRLHREYREHKHFETDVDREIRAVYRDLEKGKTIIQGAGSVVAAGVNAEGLPKLAICRADAKLGHLYVEPSRFTERRVRMSHIARYAQGHGRGERFAWSRDAWGAGLIDPKWPESYRAMVPLVPIHLRPKTALSNYHILWEAEWSRIVPRDPYLLRRIGKSDLFTVLAAWDLSEVERAVLQSRIVMQ